MSEGPDSETTTLLHATCISVADKAAVIVGASGGGKSALALNLMAFGADLVADDQVRLTKVDGVVLASAPDTISGLIEARGIGILRATSVGPIPVACIIDLDKTETERLPQIRTTKLLGQTVSLLYNVDSPHFAAAVMQYLKHGRQPEV